MEPLLFSIIAALCWIPSAVLFILGLIRSFSRKGYLNGFVKLSIICFLIPWVLSLVIRIDAFITQKRFEGTYHGRNKFDIPVTVKIKSDNTFFIIIDNIPADTIGGSYSYSKNYDAFLFQSMNHNISINQNSEGGFYLFCNEGIYCKELNEIELIKI